MAVEIDPRTKNEPGQNFNRVTFTPTEQTTERVAQIRIIQTANGWAVVPPDNQFDSFRQANVFTDVESLCTFVHQWAEGAGFPRAVPESCGPGTPSYRGEAGQEPYRPML